MVLRRALVLAFLPAFGALFLPPAGVAQKRPRWLVSMRILVRGDLQNQDCRTGVCKHNENTDLIHWRGAIWLVHRTAGSQILGPNSSLRVYRSKNKGRSFRLKAIIPASRDRDIRDPHFYRVGRRLYIKAITRLPGSGFATRAPTRSRSTCTPATDGAGRGRSRSGRSPGASGAS